MQIEKENDKSLPVLILGHSMGSLVATVAAKNCVEHPTVGPRFKKLVLSGKCSVYCCCVSHKPRRTMSPSALRLANTFTCVM